MYKILLLANNVYGLYSFRYELVQHLVDNKYDVYFAVPESHDDPKVLLLINVGAKYIHTPMNRRGMNPFEDIKLIHTYKEALSEIKPNIILTYTIKPNIYGNIAANAFNIPVIMNVTGIGSSLTTGKFKLLIKTMYRYACRKSAVVFFQNISNQQYFISKNIIDTAKAKLIPGSGVNTQKFMPSVTSKFDDVIRFLFIGRVMKEKGIEEYLQVAHRITQNWSNTEFRILGSFEEESYKVRFENNQNKQIIYLGVSDDVRNQISEVDCVVNPSYHEGMSNVLLEGAAMGKPLLASKIPGCAEIINDGQNGYLFAPKSADSFEKTVIQFLSLNENEKREMGQNSRKIIEEKFDRKIIISEYSREIGKIINLGGIHESV